MRHLIYLDESGDLGWSLDKPYKKGGSSRYLTIACVLLPDYRLASIERIVRGFYKKRKRPSKNELKSIDLSSKEKSEFINALIKLKQQNIANDIKFFAITIAKSKAKNKLRGDSNALYNYAVKRLLLDEISKYEYVDFIPDSRCEKTHARWNMREYIQQMLSEKALETTINNKHCHITPMDSHRHLALQFVDYYVAMVWASHEFNDNRIAIFEKMPGVHHQMLF